MKYCFFTIPIRNPRQAETELNTFLCGHRIVSVEKQFVANGENSCWSLCVEWVEHEGPPAKSAGKQ